MHSGTVNITSFPDEDTERGEWDLARHHTWGGWEATGQLGDTESGWLWALAVLTESLSAGNSGQIQRMGGPITADAEKACPGCGQEHGGRRPFHGLIRHQQILGGRPGKAGTESLTEPFSIPS